MCGCSRSGPMLIPCQVNIGASPKHELKYLVSLSWHILLAYDTLTSSFNVIRGETAIGTNLGICKRDESCKNEMDRKGYFLNGHSTKQMSPWLK